MITGAKQKGAKPGKQKGNIKLLKTVSYQPVRPVFFLVGKFCACRCKLERRTSFTRPPSITVAAIIHAFAVKVAIF